MLSVEAKARFWFGVILVVVATGAGVWYVLFLARYTTYEIRTGDSVSGLMAGAPVEFHGVQVGKVKRVELVDPDSVSVLLSVQRNAPVTTATVATITTRGLTSRGFTGYVYVALEDMGTAGRKLVATPGRRYPIIPTAAMRREALDSVANDINKLLHSLLDQGTITAFKQSLDGTRVIAETLAENNRKLAVLLTNTGEASEKLKPLLDSSNDTIRELHTQVLPKAYEALSRLETLSRSLNDVATEIGHNPSVLLRGTTPPEPGPGEKR